MTVYLPDIMMNFSPMRALVYRSTPTHLLSADDLAALAFQARALNALDGISGLLIAGSDRFVQLIEGSQEGIDALLERLRADQRHRDLTILIDTIVPRRSTMGWDMELIDGTAIDGGFIGAAHPLFDLLDGGLRQAILTAACG